MAKRYEHEILQTRFILQIRVSSFLILRLNHVFNPHVSPEVPKK